MGTHGIHNRHNEKNTKKNGKVTDRCESARYMLVSTERLRHITKVENRCHYEAPKSNGMETKTMEVQGNDGRMISVKQ